jgi:hypothetical protein
MSLLVYSNSTSSSVTRERIVTRWRAMKRFDPCYGRSGPWPSTAGSRG